jgi:hypothetical protein
LGILGNGPPTWGTWTKEHSDELRPKSLIKTPGVMAQWCTLSERLGPKERFWVSNPLACKWKPYWTSATELDLWMPSAACQLALLLCSQNLKKKKEKKNSIIKGKSLISGTCCRVNMLMTEHIVSQSHPLSHSICLLPSCGLKRNCSPLESVPHDHFKIAQNQSTMKKIHSFKVWEGKNWFKKNGSYTHGSPLMAFV